VNGGPETRAVWTGLPGQQRFNATEVISLDGLGGLDEDVVGDGEAEGLGWWAANHEVKWRLAEEAGGF
jgi:hypothetical protein